MPASHRQIEERKIRQERILSGALAVFNAKGLKNATMEEIAVESDFGKATLYYYFQSKEEVFSAILENGWAKLWIGLEPIIAKDKSPRENFIQILLKIAEVIKSYPELYKFLFNAPQKIIFEKHPWKQYQNRLYSTLKSLLEEGVKAEEFPEIDPKLLFKAIGGMFMGVVLMGDKTEPVSKNDIEALLNKLIINPAQQ